MARYKLVVEYDGTAYHGFQYQKGQATIQGELERALAAVLGQPLRVAGAGRTDAGVHALGQVVTFDGTVELAAPTLVRALNATLPRDIAVKHAEEVDTGFHARFSARSRTYRYRLLTTPTRSPFWERYAYQVAKPLDFDTMAAATAPLVGRHDFAAFSGAMPSDRPTMRRVRRAEWRRSGELVDFEIEADAFLPHMVRLIVGTLLRVGAGKLGPSEPAEMLARRDRARAGPAAPARGLYLVGITYENEVRR